MAAGLTAREIAVLETLHLGFNVTETGEALGIAPTKVSKALSATRSKLNDITHGVNVLLNTGILTIVNGTVVLNHGDLKELAAGGRSRMVPG